MKTLKQFQPKLLAAALLIGLCTMGGNAFAAPPAGVGGGGGGSGGGGSGGGSSESPDLGDLFVLYRDTVFPFSLPIRVSSPWRLQA